MPLNNRLKNSIEKLKLCIGDAAKELSIAIEDVSLEAPGNWWDGQDDCSRADFPNRGRFQGPGNWDPCASDISSPGCGFKGTYDQLKSFCPQCSEPDPPKPGSLPEWLGCCAPHLPPAHPLSNPSWDGNCDNPPRSWRLCARDTRNDPPGSHGWVCCRDGEHIANPSEMMAGGGGAVGSQDDTVPPIPMRPGQTPRPGGGGGFGRPGVGPRTPGFSPGRGGGFGPGPIEFDYQGFCEGKDTKGELCCAPMPGHRAARWRGHNAYGTCVNPAWIQWQAACGGNQGDEGGEGGSPG